MALGQRTSPATLVAAVLALIVSAGGIWWFLQPSTQPSPEVGQKVADEFLATLRTDAGSAWDSTSAEFKSAEGRESFQRFVKTHEHLTQPLDFMSSQTVSVQEQPRSEFVYRVTANKKIIRLVLARDSGTWKVDRLLAD